MLGGVSFEDLPKLEQQPSALLSQEFIPHISTEYVNVSRHANRWHCLRSNVLYLSYLAKTCHHSFEIYFAISF